MALYCFDYASSIVRKHILAYVVINVLKSFNIIIVSKYVIDDSFGAVAAPRAGCEFDSHSGKCWYDLQIFLYRPCRVLASVRVK